MQSVRSTSVSRFSVGSQSTFSARLSKLSLFFESHFFSYRIIYRVPMSEPYKLQSGRITAVNAGQSISSVTMLTTLGNGVLLGSSLPA